MRRRRISNDSVDSGSGERLLHMQQRPPQMAPLTCYVASSSQLTPTKRQRPSPKANSSNRGSSISPASTGSKDGGLKMKRKKHKHHHRTQKYKAKKAKREEEETANESERIKLDGSFNNTTTYSIRSPMYQASRSEDSAHEEEDDSTEESSDDESQSVSNAT